MRDLELAADAYAQRPKMTIPVGPALSAPRAPGAGAAAADPEVARRVNEGDMRSFYRKVRDWAGLTRERERYEARPRLEDGTVALTEPEGFTFAHTTAVAAARRARLRADAATRFRAIDTDGSGTLDRGEVERGAALLGMTEATALRWFAELDRAGARDGQVPVEAFLDRFAEAFKDAGLLEPSAYATGPRGLTQREARERDFGGAKGRAQLAGEAAAARTVFEARPRDPATGKVRATAATGFRFAGAGSSARNRAKREARARAAAAAKFRALDTNGSGTLDRGEALRGAALLGMGPLQVGEWFAALDAAGGGTGEVGLDAFLDKYLADFAPAAAEAAGVSRAEVNSWSRTLRDFAGLTREREAYEGRLAAGGGATRARGFSFLFRKPRRARAGAAAAATETHHVTKEDLARFDRAWRARNGAFLAEERALFEARAVYDEDGRAVPTRFEAFAFATDGVERRAGPAAAYHHTVGEEELRLVNLHRRQGLGEEMAAARASYGARVRYDEEGNALPTEAEAFDLYESGYEPRPPTVWDSEHVTRVEVREADERRRAEGAELLRAERAAYASRMGLPPPEEDARDASAFSARITDSDRRRVAPEATYERGASRLEIEREKRHSRDASASILTREHDLYQKRMAARRSGDSVDGSTPRGRAGAGAPGGRGGFGGEGEEDGEGEEVSDLDDGSAEEEEEEGDEDAEEETEMV